MLQIRRRVSAPLLWGVAALVLGIGLQINHVAQVGSLEATLRVGAESKARPFIEDDFGGPIPVAAGAGHDGWHFFLTAQDPFALDAERRPAYSAYRYRRLLGPLLAGGFGTFSPATTLLWLNAIGVLGFALVVGTTAALASRLGARAQAPLGALVNVGLWLSIQLVTADTLATGPALLAVYLSLRHRPTWAVVAMTSAVLAKETSILFAAGLAIWLWLDGQRGAGWRMAVLPMGAIAIWISYLGSVLGGALDSNSNLGFPFVGMLRPMGNVGWHRAVVRLDDHRVPGDRGGRSLAGPPSFGDRHRRTLDDGGRRLASVVWEDGNNALRVLSTSLILGVLGLAIAIGRPEQAHR